MCLSAKIDLITMPIYIFSSTNKLDQRILVINLIYFNFFPANKRYLFCLIIVTPLFKKSGAVR